MLLKKIILILAIILLITSASMGQDSTALVVGENGNVGIGTETPETLFQLRTSGGNMPGLSIKNDYTGNASFPYSFYLATDNGGCYGDGLHMGFYTNTVPSCVALQEHVMTLKRGGNVGINTPNPKATLDVQGTISVSDSFGVGTDKPGGKLDVEDNSQQILSIRRFNPNANVDKRGFVFDYDNDFVDRSIYVDVGKDPMNSGAMFFRTHTWAHVADYRFEDYTGEVHHKFNNKGHSWLNAITGNLGIGTVQPTEKLHVIGNIKYTGKLVPPSDRRLKKNINKIENPLEKINSINGVTFEWVDEKMGINREVGVIAQEVEDVFPEVVATGSDGYKGVDYSKLVAPILEAVKALKKENETLRAENILIKDQNKNITQRLSQIENLLDSLNANN